MTSASQIHLDPIILFFNEVWDGLERQAVSVQILLIAISFLIGIFAAQKINLPKEILHFKISKGIKSVVFAIVPAILMSAI